MEENNNQPQEILFKQALPNSTAVLVLGILSIVFCWCYGFGIIMGVVALAISVKPFKLYQENPEKWTSFGNLQAGRITAIIGLSISAIFLIFLIITIIQGGSNFGYEFWEEFY